MVPSKTPSSASSEGTRLFLSSAALATVVGFGWEWPECKRRLGKAWLLMVVVVLVTSGKNDGRWGFALAEWRWSSFTLIQLIFTAVAMVNEFGIG